MMAQALELILVFRFTSGKMNEKLLRSVTGYMISLVPANSEI
jgi:hypothetical protein